MKFDKVKKPELVALCEEYYELLEKKAVEIEKYDKENAELRCQVNELFKLKEELDEARQAIANMQAQATGHEAARLRQETDKLKAQLENAHLAQRLALATEKLRDGCVYTYNAENFQTLIRDMVEMNRRGMEAGCDEYTVQIPASGRMKIVAIPPKGEE